jgi:superfamily II DNA/RNA helicase
VVEDRDFVQDAKASCAYLISHDMPIEAIVYVARVSKATQKAVMLLDEEEQKSLYKIEMLLGRAIKQEVVEGFEYPQKEKTAGYPQRKKLSKEEIKEVAKKRYEKSTQPDREPEYKRDEKKREPKAKSAEKFVPKKSMAKTKTTGRKITIKALKSK